MRIAFVPLCVAALACFAVSSAAQAATLQPQQGRITLNGSAILKPVTVRSGDSISAGADSSAVIVYSNGCKLSVNPGSTIKVPATCEALGVAPLLLGGGLVAGAVTAAVLLSSNSDKPASP